MSMEQTKEYYAFISYKREDEKWAKWLQDKLEKRGRLWIYPMSIEPHAELPIDMKNYYHFGEI